MERAWETLYLNGVESDMRLQLKLAEVDLIAALAVAKEEKKSNMLMEAYAELCARYLPYIDWEGSAKISIEQGEALYSRWETFFGPEEAKKLLATVRKPR